MPTLGDAKKDDRVRVFVDDEIHNVIIRPSSSMKNVWATVILQSMHASSLIGWRDGEMIPSTATRTSVHTEAFQKGFVYHMWVTNLAQVAEIMRPGEGQPKPSPENTREEIPEWKISRAHALLPGECVCRTPKHMCTFHKDT